MGIDVVDHIILGDVAVLQLQGDRDNCEPGAVLRLLFGHLRRHDARRAARRRPAARRAERALGSLAVGGCRRARGEGAARRRVGDEVLACTSTPHPAPRTRHCAASTVHPAPTTTTHEHRHNHRAPARITIIRTAVCPRSSADRSLGARRGRPRSRQGAVPAARRGRSGDSPDAGRAGAPARGRRARLDHRHRRRRVRARVGRRRSHRLLAAERRRRHGALGARHVPGAGAGDGAAARRRAGLRRRGAEGAGDADRRADRDRRTPPRSARCRR